LTRKLSVSLCVFRAPLDLLETQTTGKLFSKVLMALICLQHIQEGI
jgi:hypothetical protein